MKKAEIYREYGIEYKNGKILSPIGWINPLLINGNSKLGKGVWTWSMLPSNKPFTVFINGEESIVYGTCPCDCVGCYAQTGFFKMPSVIESLAIKTYIARHFTAWFINAIIAQIHADNIRLCRIHASGDFFSDAYINAWKEIALQCDS